MVDVHVADVFQVVPVEYPEPPSGLDPAFPVGLEGDLVQAFFDEGLLPGVLAVPVLIDPVPPVGAVVLRDVRGGWGPP